MPLPKSMFLKLYWGSQPECLFEYEQVCVEIESRFKRLLLYLQSFPPVGKDLRFIL